MKSKRVLLTILCIVLALALGTMFTACKKQKKEEPKENPKTEAPAKETTKSAVTTTTPPKTTTTPPKTTAPAADTSSAGLPNVVEPSTSSGLKKLLGISFAAPDEYKSGAKYSVIDNQVAQLEYTMDSGKGPIKVTYRAEKSASDNSIEVSGDFTKYPVTKEVKLRNGQAAKIHMQEGTGPALALWFNKNAGGGISSSLAMDRVVEKAEIEEVANFFAKQQSKGA